MGYKPAAAGVAVPTPVAEAVPTPAAAGVEPKPRDPAGVAADPRDPRSQRPHQCLSRR